MLNQLFRRLYLIFLLAIAAVASLLLLLFFSYRIHAKRTEDSILFQRMATLINYQLEEGNDPASIFPYFEEKCHISFYLRDSRKTLLYQTNSPSPESFSALIEQAKSQTASLWFSDTMKPSTVQEGISTLNDGTDTYLFIPSTIVTKDQSIYSLGLLYRQASLLEALSGQILPALFLWLISIAILGLVGYLLLKKAFSPANRVWNSQKTFLASASHELKSPLAVILTNAEVMDRSLNDPPFDLDRFRKGLCAIDSECRRMSRLIRDLVTLAASDAGHWSIQKESVDVDTILFTLYETFEPVCLKKKIALLLPMEEERYPALFTDPNRLAQILTIFLDNAVSYAPSGSPIQIAVRFTSRTATFSVADHGPGIPAKDQPHLFERFYRGDASHHDKSHFGLGLSIARELAAMLGGKIGFCDTKGGGATFFFTLPLS